MYGMVSWDDHGPERAWVQRLREWIGWRLLHRDRRHTPTLGDFMVTSGPSGYGKTYLLPDPADIERQRALARLGAEILDRT